MAANRTVGVGSVGRLVSAIIVATVGLVAVLPPSTALMWQASVLAGEGGHWLGLVALLLLPGGRRSWVDTTASVFACLGIVLLFAPVWQASQLSRTLPHNLSQQFGPRSTSSPTPDVPRPAPLVLSDLLLGVSASDVIVDEHVYSVVDGEELTLDLYRPPHAQGALPAIVVVHGGGWTDGDKRDLADLNEYLASRGHVVASIAYRLAPRWSFPAPQDDLASAIQYVKDLEHTHSLDPNRIALMGRSVGAQIVALAAYATTDPSIRGVVSFYGPFALRWGYANPARPGVVDSSGILDLYLGGPPATHGEQYDAAEPSRFVTSSTPPTLFIQGMRDEHVSPFHAEFVSAQLLEAGVPHHIVRMPWATHGCDYLFSGPCGQISTYAAEHFLSTVLRNVE